MVIVPESASGLKRFLRKTLLSATAQLTLLRLMLGFMHHRGRMSCSQAAGSVASQAVHRAQMTRFLARPRWRKQDFNRPLRIALLKKESRRGKFLFLIDATLVSQAGKKTPNTFSTGNRGRNPAKGRRYNKKKVVYKKCHSFTFGLLLTPSGIRIPFQIPYFTQEYCREHGLRHRTTAEAAAELIAGLPLPPGAEVIVLGDTAYDAAAVRKACQERGYTWICPANPERVYEGAKGKRLKLRSRLKDWTSLSLKTIRLCASEGPYVRQRRLSPFRRGPKARKSVYYAHQEKTEVHNVGCVSLVFSTIHPHLEKATSDDVKILMTNAAHLSAKEVIELYSLRWQIELFFKEIKSTLGFSRYRFQRFAAVEAWAETVIATVLYLEEERARRLQDHRLGSKRKAWWEGQRLHGLAEAVRQQAAEDELAYLAERLETPGGIAKLKRFLQQAIPAEYRAKA